MPSGYGAFTHQCAPNYPFFVTSSVTRFHEISPLWQNFKVFGNIFEGAFSIWKNFEPTSANFPSHWANLYCWQWPNI